MGAFLAAKIFSFAAGSKPAGIVRPAAVTRLPFIGMLLDLFGDGCAVSTQSLSSLAERTIIF
jgi:hypothetical protein